MGRGQSPTLLGKDRLRAHETHRVRWLVLRLLAGILLALPFTLDSALSTAATITYVYDRAGRLKSASTTTDGSSVSYTLDPAGNRTQVVASPPTALPGTLQFASASYSVAENLSSITIGVSRNGGMTGAIGVSYTTANGTALAGSDYTTTSGVLSWANGDSATKTFVVPILNDSTFESTETFTTTLNSPTGGATLGSPSSSTVSVTDDDPNIPSVPTNIRKSPTTGTGWSYAILWDASTGPVNHYTLLETIEDPSPGSNTYSVTVLNKNFNKGQVYLLMTYKVRACATANESQCSAYSQTVMKMVCPSTGCP